jgi:PhnB protein
MAKINPYINFNGNTEEAFNFYKSVFGGEFDKIIRFNKIMRIGLNIGGNTLLANDVPESMGPVNENENRSKISITAESRAEADEIYNGLTVGGAIEVPIGDSPWSTYFGMFRDKFGIEWTIEFDPNTDGKQQNKL